MSEADRRVAEHIAQSVVARILEAAKNKETASGIMEVWGGEIDRTLGRGLRRLGFYVVVALMGIASAKLGLLDKVWSLFRP